MSDLPVLRRLHRLWLAFVVVVVGILAALPLLETEPSDLPVVLPATLAVAGGGAAFIAIVALDLTFASSPPANDARALAEYEARVTLGFAIAQAPALLGFALTFVFGMLTAAALGGVASALCLWRARPSQRRLERLEAAWRDAGSEVSALRAAAGEPDPTRDEPDQAEADAEPGEADGEPADADPDEADSSSARPEPTSTQPEPPSTPDDPTDEVDAEMAHERYGRDERDGPST